MIIPRDSGDVNAEIYTSQAIVFPVAGSFASYSTRFLDPAWGFAMGWKV